QKRYK
ncbi:UTP--glucose-1-phosphate uridylyltransferase, partial [Haemophilus influenzae]